MKLRPISLVIVTCALASFYAMSLKAESQPSWQECGENWAYSLENGMNASTKLYEVTKEGIKKISHKKVPNNLTLYGRVQLNDVSITKNFTCYGFAEVAHATVQGVTTMYGPMSADHSSFTDIDIRCANEMLDEPGTAQFSHTNIQKLFINGKLIADASSIKSITTFFSELEISNSYVGDIIMMNGSCGKKKKTLIVLNNTIVEGSIQFSQKGGTVICKGTSLVKGEVVGGIVEKVS